MNLTPPVFPNPLTDFCFLIAPRHNQLPSESLCARLEMKFMDCLEAYGSNRVREKCADLMYDMIECRRSTLQLLRTDAIRAERMRQYRAGQLKKPFDEYPPLDSFLNL